MPEEKATAAVLEKPAEPPQERIFYSSTAELFICANPGQVVMMNGSAVRLGEKHIRFLRIGQDNYGLFRTDDPELIAYLEKRMLRSGDVFTPEEYKRRIKPDQETIRDLSTNLQERNRLYDELMAKQADLERENERLKAASAEFTNR